MVIWFKSFVSNLSISTVTVDGFTIENAAAMYSALTWNQYWPIKPPALERLSVASIQEHFQELSKVLSRVHRNCLKLYKIHAMWKIFSTVNSSELPLTALDQRSLFVLDSTYWMWTLGVLGVVQKKSAGFFCHKSPGRNFGFAGWWSHPDLRGQMVSFFISLLGPKWWLNIALSLHCGWMVQDGKHTVSSSHSLTSAVLYSKGSAFRKGVAIIQTYFSAVNFRRSNTGEIS